MVWFCSLPPAVLLLFCAHAYGEELDLLAQPWRWQAGIDRGGTVMTLTPTPEAPLAVTIVADGGEEDYPKLTITWDQPQDWRKFTRIRSRIRLTCNEPQVRSKYMAFVFYDEQVRRQDLPDHPMTQQSFGRTVPVGRWVEFDDWLLNIGRSSIRKLDLYLYEQNAPPGLQYRWEFAGLSLRGVGETATQLDLNIYPTSELRSARSGQPVGTVETSDGLGLTLGSAGEVKAVTVDGQTVGAPGSAPCGLMVRDATTDQAPVVVGGDVAVTEEGLRQSATLDTLGLAVEARYQSVGGYLEVTGAVSDLTGQDRAITVLFALPVSDAPWLWWDSIARSRSPEGEPGELTNLETGMAWGYAGAHSKYPLGAITWPQQAGLTLAIRMDEPVVHRILYNAALRLFLISFDFGLVPENNVHGVPLSRAPFRFLIYRHDPKWGFRSALQRYYDFFPEFFVRRARVEGGWYVWGNAADTPGAKEAGFAFHWGPSGLDAVRWDNENDFLSLCYIEPEFFQLTMGDYDRAPTAEEGLERLRRIAEGDEEEMAKFEKLGYASSYVPYAWVREHSFREALQTVARAAVASVHYDDTFGPYSQVGQFPWMSESQWGIIYPCNLDPDIPGGKGWFCRHVYIAPALRATEAAGARYDGIALDSFGGYGQTGRADYRRENFKFSDLPLTFSALEQQPVRAANFCTWEWLRDLARDMHAESKVLMANCAWNFAPAWLSFAAPYLDIFGAEAPSFGDPEFMRAIAYRKPLTDLPYTPRPDWEVEWHLLLGIYPGHGNDLQMMARIAPTLRALAKAGWEPITLARAEPASVRIERYGAGDTVYLSLHNPGPATRAVVELDPELGLNSFTCTALPDEQMLEPTSSPISVDLAAEQTVVLRLTRQELPVSINSVGP